MIDPDEIVEIDIVNWGNHQTSPDGGLKWIKISPGALTDVKFCALSPTAQLLWFKLLLYAGIHGVPFKSSRRALRVPLQCRHTADLEPLLKQGLITIKAPKRERERDKRDKRDIYAAESKNRFEEFYQAYPRKKNKPYALQCWNRGLKKDGKVFKNWYNENCDKLIADVRKRITDDQDWVADDGEYIPHPSTYLNQHVWDGSMRKPTKKKRKIPSDHNQLLAMAKELSVNTRGLDEFEVKEAIREKLNE